MKKIIVFFLIGILVLSGLGAVNATNEIKNQNISEKILVTNVKISEQNEFVSISIDETTHTTISSNKPMLPMITKTYTFPLGTKIDKVIVDFSDPIEIEIEKPVLPTPEIFMKKSINNYKQKTTDEIKEIYSKIEVYPENKFEYKTGAGLKDSKHVIFLTAQIYPIQYKPIENKLLFSKVSEIKVTYKLPDKTVIFPDEYDMLIIAPSQFSSNLQPLIDYKNEHNIQTKLVTLDEIPDQGVDEQESIKYYVKDAIENWGITYLLLVGGSDNFPVRNAWVPSGNYEKYFPSDLYYADIYDSEMAFSNWDKDGDGKYAEFSQMSNDMDNVDMYPDVYLGKLPCNDAIEVAAIVEKIINYEQHNKMTNKIVQIGGDTFPGDPEGINEGEYANEEVLSKLSGYSTTRIWASQKNGAQKLSKRNIANGFNDLVDFVDFSGHGSWGSWATHATNDDHVWLPDETLISPYTGWLYIDYDMYSVSNELKHPVVVFNACSCSKYTESRNCMSWKTIKSKIGGIASFGASGIGYGSYGSYETKRVWGWMEVHIHENIFNEKILGKAWADCLNDYINSFYNQDWEDSDYKTILEMAMFGDPSLAIEDGEEPKVKTVNTTIFNILLEKIIDILPRFSYILGKINNIIM